MLDFSSKNKDAVYKPLISENQPQNSRSSTWSLLGLMVFLGAALVLTFSLHEGTSQNLEVSIGALEPVPSGDTFDLKDGEINQKNIEKFTELAKKLDPLSINEKPKTLVPKDAKNKKDKEWRIDLQGITDKYANIQYQVGKNTLATVLVHVDVLSEKNMKQKGFPDQVKEAIAAGLWLSGKSAKENPKQAKIFKIDPEGGSQEKRKAEDDSQASPSTKQKGKKQKKEDPKTEKKTPEKEKKEDSKTEKKTPEIEKKEDSKTKKKPKRQGVKSFEK